MKQADIDKVKEHFGDRIKGLKARQKKKARPKK